MASLQERLAERRRLLQRERRITLPVPGYRDILAATYRPLPYEEIRHVTLKHQQIGEKPEDEVAAAADVLCRACEDLLERNEDGEYESLGKRWTPSTVIELFPEANVPEGALASTALVMALSSDQVIKHFGEYQDWAQGVEDEAQRESEGEFEAATAAVS